MSRTVLMALLVLGPTACSVGGATEPVRALRWTLVAGTLIEASLEDSRSWRRNALDEILTATVSADVMNGQRAVVIPAGSIVRLRMARSPAESTRVDARITLDVLFVTVRGRQYPVRATAELTALAVYHQRRRVVVVAPQTRILFPLSDGFTAAIP